VTVRETPVAAPPSPQPAGKRPGRARRLIRLALAFLTAVVVVDAIVGENGVLALIEKRRQFAALTRALEQAKDDNAALRDRARRLRQDPSTIESVARRDLGLIKPGEKVFIIKDAAPRR
jgi:cell division protein FtsB